MSLYQKLLGIEPEPGQPGELLNIPSEQFISSMNEWARGFMALADVHAACVVVKSTEPGRTYPLTAGELTQLNELIATLGDNEVQRLRELVKIRDALLLGEFGVRYTTEAALKTRLGVL